MEADIKERGKLNIFKREKNGVVGLTHKFIRDKVVSSDVWNSGLF